MSRHLPYARMRQSIYSIMDWVAETGEAVELTYEGGSLRIIPRADESTEPGSRAALPAISSAGSPEEIVHLDWDNEWHEDPEVRPSPTGRPTLLFVYYKPYTKRFARNLWARWDRRKRQRE